MRWTEITEWADNQGVPCPTYRQLDVWTASGRLHAEMRRGHPGGKYRWWNDSEVEVALLVARLISVGMDVDLAFDLARTRPDDLSGSRVLLLDAGRLPVIRVEVGAPTKTVGT